MDERWAIFDDKLANRQTSLNFFINPVIARLIKWAAFANANSRPVVVVVVFATVVLPETLELGTGGVVTTAAIFATGALGESLLLNQLFVRPM
jgi:hypothetical protein